MKVRCARTVPTLPAARRLGKRYSPGQEFPVTVGKVYSVFGVRIWSGAPWLDIEAIPGYLVSVPFELFEVVDGRLPAIWVATSDNEGDLSFTPESFRGEYFMDDLFEGKEQAVLAFQAARLQTEDHDES